MSNLARVRRCERYIERSNGYAYRVAEKIIAQGLHERGYKTVGLKVAPKINRVFLVHRLVAQAFVSNPHSHPDVNHLDLNKENNAPDNLEWCTKSQNTNHATIGGRFHGRSNPNARFKLQPEQVDDILQQLANGIKQDTLAEQLSVSQSLISQIAHGRCWREPPTELPCES